MNGLLDFLARTGEKFDKDEIYTFIAGLVAGAAYYVLFAKKITPLIGEISFSNPLFFLSLLFAWLLLTILVYIIENVIILISCVIFWLRNLRTDWDKKITDYKKVESQVRHLNEFSQLTSGMHLWGLISAVLIMLYFLNDRIAQNLDLSPCAVRVVFLTGALISSYMVIRITFRWLALEKLFLGRAFGVVNDVNIFLSYYGVHVPVSENSSSQKMEDQPPSPS